MDKLNSYKIMGVPLGWFAVLSAIIMGSMYMGGLGTDILSTIAYLAVLGGIFMEIGNRIPIFNKWIGGGSMLAIMLPSWMVYVHILPEKYIESATLLYDEIGWQTFFICLLMAGSLIVIERRTLIKSLVRYIPVVLVGVVTAGIFGVVVGTLLGYSISDLLVMYVLPIMGGGNGAGAIPMSQIYAQVTGGDKDSYYSVALAILTLANVLCIIVAALLSGIGNKFTSLTGDGKTLMRNEGKEKVTDKEAALPKPTMQDVASSFLWVGAAYGLSCLCAKVLFPTIGGIPIHQYAWFVVLIALANIFNLVPLSCRSGIKMLSDFMVKSLGAFGFAAIGIVMTDFGEFMTAATDMKNMIICLAVVVGATVGTAVFGWIVGFYPIDSAITAGLCMANRGGGGDLVVLGAANRLELMSYAAVSSRLGGGLILVIAGLVFSILY